MTLYSIQVSITLTAGLAVASSGSISLHAGKVKTLCHKGGEQSDGRRRAQAHRRAHWIFRDARWPVVRTLTSRTTYVPACMPRRPLDRQVGWARSSFSHCRARRVCPPHTIYYNHAACTPAPPVVRAAACRPLPASLPASPPRPAPPAGLRVSFCPLAPRPRGGRLGRSAGSPHHRPPVASSSSRRALCCASWPLAVAVSQPQLAQPTARAGVAVVPIIVYTTGAYSEDEALLPFLFFPPMSDSEVCFCARTVQRVRAPLRVATPLGFCLLAQPAKPYAHLLEMPCRPLRWLQATRLATRGEATRPGCYLVLTSSSSLDSTALRLQACKAGCDCNRGGAVSCSSHVGVPIICGTGSRDGRGEGKQSFFFFFGWYHNVYWASTYGRE